MKTWACIKCGNTIGDWERPDPGRWPDCQTIGIGNHVCVFFSIEEINKASKFPESLNTLVS
jgi:hypothetical protein